MNAMETVTTALEGRGSSEHRGGKWNCPGPAHANGDRDPSLSVKEIDGKVLLYCHLGERMEDIVDALGLAPKDLYDDDVREPREVARYPYVSRDGILLYNKIRFEPGPMGKTKTFTLDRKVNGSRPLYRLPEMSTAIKEGRRIWICEGEKGADLLWGEGEAATCAGGANNWLPEYVKDLYGADVVIVADRDEPGIKYARNVYTTLKGKARSVRVVQSKTLREHDDIVDHLEAGHSLGELVSLNLEHEITQLYIKVDWTQAFKEQPDEVDWLLPPVLEAGTINALFGKPGVGKSLITLEFAIHLVREGRTVMMVDEENRVEDMVERLRNFGVEPWELDRLIVYNFASLPALDTPSGGEHLSVLVEANEPDLLILDTTTRMVEGDENNASTWLQLYRNSLVPLKKRGVTILRLDHPGKDDTRGQRGSSAKAGDVDTVWRLSDASNSDQLVLIREKSRSGHGEPVITYRRLLKPLRHEIIALGDLDVLPQVRGLSGWFDRRGVPRDAGRPRLRDELSSALNAPECSTTMLALIAKYRKSQDSSGQV